MVTEVFTPFLSLPSFSLDKDTGVILLIARLDFETMQRYTLTVIARDGGGEETAGRIRINVLDVNDNVPTFQKEAYLGALRENEPSVTQVVRLRVRDSRGQVPIQHHSLHGQCSICAHLSLLSM